MEKKLITKNDLLNKLRAYKTTPDDDVILYKQKIKNALLSNPCLLYALDDKELESELFDKHGNINWEWNEDTKQYESLGEWDRYFGSDSLIRPFLFIPDTQTTVKCYVCYQVGFRDTVRHQPGLKETQVTFTIFAHGDDRALSSTFLTGINGATNTAIMPTATTIAATIDTTFKTLLLPLLAFPIKILLFIDDINIS